MVNITDYVDAKTGTSLGPRLLAEAHRAAAESAAATGWEARTDDPGETPNDELQKCLVAILCAHAALEAQMNDVGDAIDPAWWAGLERTPMWKKWRCLMERHQGTKPPRSDPTYKAVLRLSSDRNSVAHHRGLRQSDGTYARAKAPDTARRGITFVRAHFDAARARAAVDDAEAAFRVL